MRKILLLIFLCGTTMAFAQRKELRKIDNAISSGDMKEALTIFNTINESEVEDKYLGKYKFYKAAVVSGVIDQSRSNYENVKEAEQLLKESVELGYKKDRLFEMVEGAVFKRKRQIINERLQASDTAGALEIIDDIYEANPSDKDMLFTSAQLSYQSEDFEAARKKFQELYDYGYTGETTTYYATKISNNQEEVFPSVKLRELSIKQARSHKDPRDEVSPSQLGLVVGNLVWLYKQDNQLDKAKFIFEKALKNYPNDVSLKLASPEIYNNLGMIDEYKKAVEEADGAVKDPQVLDNLGIAAFKAKDYDAAIKYFEKSIAIEPDNYSTLVNIGNAYLEKGNKEGATYEEQTSGYKKALEWFENAHEADPSQKNILPTMASLYDVFEMKDKAEAIRAKM